MAIAKSGAQGSSTRSIFRRVFADEIDLQSQGNRLLYDLLKNDIVSGNVFPAIRNRYIDFYYKGGRLFEYRQGEFKTHIKYASVLTLPKGKSTQANADGDENYLTAKDFQNLQYISDFAGGYKRIKENCSLYSGDEAAGVASIYSQYSYANKHKRAGGANNGRSNVVVLDIEIAFDKGKDRIDVLLYNKAEKTLRFCEAKHYSNKELWSRPSIKPPVVNQLERYKAQITSKKEQILTAYRNYVNCVNTLFDLDLPLPQNVEDDVVLLIFGYDRDQFKGRFRDLLINDGSLGKVHYYSIGNIAGANIDNIWRKTR
ncbi:MAG: hypothetical protein ABFD12_11890 [Syntrophorhabdus sp.]